MSKRAMIPRFACLLGCWLLLGTGCSAEVRYADAVDCSVTDSYELSSPLVDFESGALTWYGSGDSTGAPSKPDPLEPNVLCGGSGETPVPSVTGTGTESYTQVPIENGGRCGSTQALELKAAGHTDWGAFFGNYAIANPDSAWDGSGYEGISFWARSGGGDPAFTLALDTWQTSAAGTEEDPSLANQVCKVDCSAGSGTRSVDEAGNIKSQSYVSPPGTCGNSFQRVVVLSPEWRFYAIPFDSFWQELKPNLAPEGLDPRHINGFLVRTAKEALVDIWLDDIAFYKRK